MSGRELTRDELVVIAEKLQERLDITCEKRDVFRERAVTAEQERDRLRREVEALRDESRRGAVYSPDRRRLADRLDAILRGES
jgi:hypothetical protein